MANVGTGPSGETLIGDGRGVSPTFAAIGTNSGLTAHGVVIAEGNGAFVASAIGTSGEVFTSNGTGNDPTFQAPAASSISITGNTGGTLTGNAFDFLTANSTVKFSGSGITETLDFGVTNLFFGNTGPSITTGTSNISIGSFNSSGITSGISNIAFGFGAGNALQTASGNVLMGLNAGSQIVSTNDNIAIGSRSCQSIVTGTDNVCIGADSLPTAGTNSSNNTCIGFGSAGSITLGNNNSCFGYESLLNSLTSSYIIAMGYQSASNYTGAESSNIMIGNLGTVGESNVIRIGTQGSGAGQQNKNFTAGITGVTAVGSPVAVSSTGQLSDLGFGTATQVLTSNGPGVSATWQAAEGSKTSAFLAYLTTQANGVTGDGTVYQVIQDTIAFQNGTGFNATTGIFTAPVTGLYHFNACVYFSNPGTAIGYTVQLQATSITLQNNMNFAVAQQTGNQVSGLISMTAGDTCKVNAIGSFGTKTINITQSGVAGAANNTFFSGYLVA